MLLVFLHVYVLKCILKYTEDVCMYLYVYVCTYVLMCICM